MNKTIEIKKVHLKNLFLSTVLSFLLISCFTEPKKIREKVKKAERTVVYEKEELTLKVLNKLLRFQIKDFEIWCKSQNFIYDSRVYDEGYICYSNTDKSKLVSLSKPKDIASKARVSYHTSLESEYKQILSGLESLGYKLKSKNVQEIKYYNQNTTLTININDVSEEIIYSISLKTL